MKIAILFRALKNFFIVILLSNLQIRILDSAMGTVERRIFELRLAVGDEQHVIYVKEEVNSFDKDRIIQVECSKRINL